jgi:hypothetical protein
LPSVPQVPSAIFLYYSGIAFGSVLIRYLQQTLSYFEEKYLYHIL